jgi:hypothetical protein
MAVLGVNCARGDRIGGHFWKHRQAARAKVIVTFNLPDFALAVVQCGIAVYVVMPSSAAIGEVRKSNFALRLQSFLLDEARKLAAAEGVAH